MESCPTCAFALWHPLHEDSNIQLGLYDDGRFPGRIILSLKNHHEQLDDVPPTEAILFMEAIQNTSKIMKKVTRVERINVAILGNQEAHVHAHLIPRRPTDGAPTKAPWEDPRPRRKLSARMLTRYLTAYRGELSKLA